MDAAEAVRLSLEKLYQEHRTQARHYDTLRTGLITVLATVAGALLALATAGQDRAITRSDFGLGLVIFVIGVFGVAASLKLVAKLMLEDHLAKALRREIDFGLQDQPIERIYTDVKAEHARRWGIIDKFRMRWLWATLAALICVLGLVVMALPYLAL